MKFCKDCNHCRMIAYGKLYWKCAQKIQKQCLISGEPEYSYCVDARNNPDSCGPLGRFFEPKQGD